MDLNVKMNPQQMAKLSYAADRHNKMLKAQGIKNDKGMGQDRYLKLLVTQLKYQDPLSPMKNQEFAAQMAQFSSLNQMTKLNSSMTKMLTSSRMSENYNLLGKKVEWIDKSSKDTQSGVVQSVALADGQPYLLVDGKKVKPDDLLVVTKN